MNGLDSARAQFAQLASRAKRPVAITGAGVSAESGVPTFRSNDGLWNNFRPEELATPEAFADNPERVWEWYGWRRGLIRDAAPNPAHRWLAAYEQKKPGFLLITQNVDGLHLLAGSRDMVEIHGNLWRTRCLSCSREQERRDELGTTPRCERCGGRLRPAVVWFGESLPEQGLMRAVEAVRNCDLLLMLGTSAVVYPVAGFPELATHAITVEINPEPTPFTPRATHSVRAPAGAFLEPLSY